MVKNLCQIKKKKKKKVEQMFKNITRGKDTLSLLISKAEVSSSRPEIN
jgi:hypothetical protein